MTTVTPEGRRYARTKVRRAFMVWGIVASPAIVYGFVELWVQVPLLVRWGGTGLSVAAVGVTIILLWTVMRYGKYTMSLTAEERSLTRNRGCCPCRTV